MIEQEKTAAEMLEYYKTEVFGKMGIEIEGLQNKDAAYQKWARVSVADQMLGLFWSHHVNDLSHQGESSDAGATRRVGRMACRAGTQGDSPRVSILNKLKITSLS